MTTETFVYLAIIGLCTIASGFFSGSETALIGISRERVHRLASQGPKGKRLEKLVSQPDRMLSTLLVANNTVNVLSASVAAILFVSLIGETWGPWVATGVMTAVLLVFGEITPKTIAARYPEQFSLRVAPTIWNLSIVLAPIARFFSAITRGLLRLLRLDVDGSADGVTEDDIRALAALSQRGGQIEKAEREIIDALFHLADTSVRDVMTPRLDIVTLPLPLTAHDLRTAVTATGHSRFPVTTEGLDDLQGIVHVKDLLRQPEPENTDDLSHLVRTPNYVPETMSVLDTLEAMRDKRYGMAVVVDEHGGVEGIVTIKDLVSELVGELQDEYDPGTPAVTQIAARVWIADGRVDIDDLSEAIDHEIPEGPYSTVGGFIITTFGKIPVRGNDIIEQGYRYTVLSMDRQRVDRIKVERLG
ncbi:MAG: hemolysin family protein [Acidimicrobiia bacterium]|nr:MAG: hemolysin family protein [Acidimicrobiia bacterium]